MAKPQDLPTSSGLLMACTVASFASYFFGNALLSGSTNVISITATQVIILGAGLWLLLLLYRKPQRWLQSAAAIYGTSAIMHMITIPIIIWIDRGAHSTERLSGPMWGVAAVQIWLFAIIVNILRETLEISIGLSLIISLAMQIAFAVVLFALFGA